MSLRFALIGMLADRPLSGYELSKMFGYSLNHVWSTTHSQIYQELNKLTKEGLVEVVDTGPRGRKDYAATEAGVTTLREWLVNTEPDFSYRNDPLLRSFFLWVLEPPEAQAILEKQIAFSRQKIAGYEQTVEHWTPETEADHASRIVLEAGLRIERARLDWAEWAWEQYAGDGSSE